VKPAATLSLDLDNQWSYMKTHGDAGWEAFPSYLDVAVPRVLEMLDRKGLTITFMVVGQDAALGKNGAALRRIGESGHEVGNHSFHHEQWMHLRSTQWCSSGFGFVSRARPTWSPQREAGHARGESSPQPIQGPFWLYLLPCADAEGQAQSARTLQTVRPIHLTDGRACRAPRTGKAAGAG